MQNETQVAGLVRGVSHLGGGLSLWPLLRHPLCLVVRLLGRMNLGGSLARRSNPRPGIVGRSE
jgi:hypothetical protein